MVKASLVFPTAVSFPIHTPRHTSGPEAPSSVPTEEWIGWRSQDEAWASPRRGSDIGAGGPGSLILPSPWHSSSVTLTGPGEALSVSPSERSPVLPRGPGSAQAASPHSLPRVPPSARLLIAPLARRLSSPPFLVRSPSSMSRRRSTCRS